MIKKAFTLAELLTAVLVISVIMVALAPVITKRMEENLKLTMQTESKKGLEIYANPGTYAFDIPIGVNTLYLQGSGGGGGGAGAARIEKTLTFNSSTTLTIPKGVNEITMTIYGAGGGGGGGYGKTGSESCPYVKLPNMADNGRDLCYFNKNMDNVLGTGQQGCCLYIVNSGTTPALDAACYKGTNLATVQYTASGGLNPASRMVCSPKGAKQYCECYLPGPKGSTVWGLGWGASCHDATIDPSTFTHIARLIKTSELKRLLDKSPAPNYTYLTPSYLDYVGYNTKGLTTKVSSISSPSNGCKYTGSRGNFCFASVFISDTGHLFWSNKITEIASTVPNVYSLTTTDAGIPICVYEMRNWTPYGGGGGASGAKYTITKNVMPDDTLEITIGTGGSGGSAGANGSKGGKSQIVHKRNGTTLATYYADGGIGGNKATSSASGAKTSTKAGCSSSAGCTTIVTTDSGIGYAGGTTSGGKGAGNIAAGTPDVMPTNASNNTGYGGGGGFCGRTIRSAGSCQSGGKGGSGKVEIKFNIMLPGSGGGSATRVGGENSSNKSYEIEYKVTEGSQLVFEVGSGGAGGEAGQNGLNGTPTTIQGDRIIFLAGEGGKAITQTQKDNLTTCIGTSSTAITNCINNSSYKAQGGRSGIIGIDGAVVSTTTGLLINNSQGISYTIQNLSYKGQNGNMPSQVSEDTVPWKYGFDGGVGGAPFGIRSANAAAAVSCGGGMIGSYGVITEIANYFCTSGNINGNSGKKHDAANNEFGGSGGGGGGMIENSSELGAGGNGSNGYLRIRWDAPSQI